MRYGRMLVIGSLLFASVGIVRGQQTKEPPPPATKLEEFSAKTGIVVIRGFETIGEVRGMGSVTITAREFRDASNPKLKQTGLTVELKESGRLERESISFVDYDEIDSLLRGIDYISKIERNVTSLKNFEAEYRTKGDFAITTLNERNGSIGVAVSSGRFSKVSAYLKLSDLPQLRTYIVNAKAIIDSAK